MKTKILLLLLLLFAETVSMAGNNECRSIDLRLQSSSAKISQQKNPLPSKLPEGKSKKYIREGFRFNSYSLESEKYSYVSEIIFAENNEVYIVNPIANYDLYSDNYIKGSIENNIITVKFPQEAPDINNQHLSINRVIYNNGYVVADQNEIKFTVAEDGRIVMEESSIGENGVPSMMMAPFSHIEDWGDYFVGYGEYNQVYTPFDDDFCVMPEDANVEEFILRYNGNKGQIVNVGIKDNQMYISNLNKEVPEAVIQGTISGDKITFPSEQYLGIYAQRLLYFSGADTERGYFQLTDEVVFDYDKTSKSISSTSSFVLGYDDLKFLTLGCVQPTFRPVIKDVKFTNPENPEFTHLESLPEFGVATASISFSMFDLNGNWLDPDRMYYNILFDGEKYGVPYYDFEEGKEVLEFDYPFSYGSPDIWRDHQFQVRFEYMPAGSDINEIQAQLFYKAADGTIYASDIVSYEGNSVKKTELEQKDIIKTIYTNMYGIVVTNPQNGLYIKTDIYSDGTKKSEKQIFNNK